MDPLLQAEVVIRDVIFSVLTTYVSKCVVGGTVFCVSKQTERYSMVLLLMTTWTTFHGFQEMKNRFQAEAELF